MEWLEHQYGTLSSAHVKKLIAALQTHYDQPADFPMHCARFNRSIRRLNRAQQRLDSTYTIMPTPPDPLSVSIGVNCAYPAVYFIDFFVWKFTLVHGATNTPNLAEIHHSKHGLCPKFCSDWRLHRTHCTVKWAFKSASYPFHTAYKISG